MCVSRIVINLGGFLFFFYFLFLKEMATIQIKVDENTTLQIPILDKLIFDKMCKLDISVYGGYVRDLWEHGLNGRIDSPTINDLDLKFSKDNQCREIFYTRLVADPNLVVSLIDVHINDYNERHENPIMKHLVNKPIDSAILNDSHYALVFQVSFRHDPKQNRIIDTSFQSKHRYICERNLDMDVNGLSMGPFFELDGAEFKPYITKIHNQVSTIKLLDLEKILQNIKKKKFICLNGFGECTTQKHKMKESFMKINSIIQFDSICINRECIHRDSIVGKKRLARIQKMILRGWTMLNTTCPHPKCILALDNITTEYDELLLPEKKYVDRQIKKGKKTIKYKYYVEYFDNTFVFFTKTSQDIINSPPGEIENDEDDWFISPKDLGSQKFSKLHKRKVKILAKKKCHKR